MSKYKGLFTFDVENHRYLPVEQADGLIAEMDYRPEPEPKEPLIKDEKIRKAVRAWAEINLILDDDDVEASTPTVDCNVLTLTYGTISIDVFVNDTITIINHGHYTIAELCGEEEG